MASLSVRPRSTSGKSYKTINNFILFYFRTQVIRVVSRFDLVIIGSGSAATTVAFKALEEGKNNGKCNSQTN